MPVVLLACYPPIDLVHSLTVRTPHLALVLLFRVLYREYGSPFCDVMVDLEVWRDFEMQFPCRSTLAVMRDHVPPLCHAPNGPVTVTVLFATVLQFVGSLFAFGSPMSSSTPGGIEMGVRPSLDGLVVVEEKVRRVWRAGTRKLGRGAAEGEEATALSKALLLHGANILGWSGLPVVVGFAMISRS